MNNFGASGPSKVLQDEFGFRKENVVAAAKEQLRRAM
jgi:transketolase